MTRISSYAHRYKRPPRLTQRPWLDLRPSPRKRAVARQGRARGRRLRRVPQLPRQTRTGQRNQAHRAMRNVTSPRPLSQIIPNCGHGGSARNGARSVAMTARPVPRRHWRRYGDAPSACQRQDGRRRGDADDDRGRSLTACPDTARICSARSPLFTLVTGLKCLRNG